jgi:hypothetical protein
VLSGASREFEAAADSATLALGLAQALAWIYPAPPSARARSLGKSAMSLSTECCGAFGFFLAADWSGFAECAPDPDKLF